MLEKETEQQFSKKFNFWKYEELLEGEGINVLKMKEKPKIVIWFFSNDIK